MITFHLLHLFHINTMILSLTEYYRSYYYLSIIGSIMEECGLHTLLVDAVVHESVRLSITFPEFGVFLINNSSVTPS